MTDGFILGIIVLVMFAIFLYAILEYEKFKKCVYDLMQTAEQYAEEYQLETGQQKFEFVVMIAWTNLPPILRIFVTRRMIEKIIQHTYDEMRGFIKASYCRYAECGTESDKTNENIK